MRAGASSWDGDTRTADTTSAQAARAAAHAPNDLEIARRPKPKRRSFRHLIRVCLTLEFIAMSYSAGAQGLVYPETPRRKVTDVFHGTPVSEDYRWLEAVDSPSVHDRVEQ